MAIPGEFVPLYVRYYRDKAIRRAGNDGELMFTRAIAFCRANRTDGRIEDFDLDELGRGMGDPEAVAAVLVRNDLWVTADDGWLIRSWEKWNETAAEDPSTAGTRGNHERWHVKRGMKDDKCQYCYPEKASAPSGRIAPTSPRHRPDDRPESGAMSPRIAEREGEREGEREQNLPSPDGEDEGPGVELELIEPPAPARPASDYDQPGFAEFWNAYPRKVDKKAAAKAYKSALKRATVDQLIAGANAYAGQSLGRDTQHIKHAATWLNGDCWNNDPEPNHTTPAATRGDIDWDAAFTRAQERTLHESR